MILGMAVNKLAADITISSGTYLANLMAEDQKAVYKTIGMLLLNRKWTS